MIGTFAPNVVELLSLLSRHEVRYLLVGGQAVIRYGYARLTGDVDLFFDQTTTNTLRVWAALQDFWGPAIPGLSAPEELDEPGMFVLFGRPPNRVDFLSTLGSVRFAEAWDRRTNEPAEWDGRPFVVPVISRRDLIRSKRDAGRPKDLADLAFLEALEPEQDG